MVNSSITRRLLSPILLLALAAGCSDRTSNAPGETQAVEAPTKDPSEPVSEAPPAAEEERVLTISREKQVDPKDFTPEQRAQIDLMLSRMGEVTLTLDDGPPTADSLEPGRYFLSISILLSNGRPMKNQAACRVEVDGPDVRILLEDSNTDPILATFEAGVLLSDPVEGPGTYGFDGQIVGPGKLRGTIIRGPEPNRSIDILEGRWGLDALPLKKDTDESSAG